jgi:uncharacterized protein YggE
MRTLLNGTASRLPIAIATIAVLALGMITAPMLAGSPRTTLAADPQPNEHVISVTGTGKVTIKPDVADVSLGVYVQRETAKAARDAAAEAMNNVLAALKNLGIADDDIKTSIVDLSPQYDYNSGQRIIGWQITNIVSVHVRDLTKLADVIDGSVASGATTVSGVSFDVSDRATAENQARDAAVKDARSHADALAAAAGVTISGVRSISESSYSAPYPWYGVADASKGGAPGAPTVPTPIQPGTQDITISVTVDYLI